MGVTAEGRVALTVGQWCKAETAETKFGFAMARYQGGLFSLRPRSFAIGHGHCKSLTWTRTQPPVGRLSEDWSAGEVEVGGGEGGMGRRCGGIAGRPRGRGEWILREGTTQGMWHWEGWGEGVRGKVY